MIYDSFMFYNEMDILELRLKELWDVVDWFVLVEMPVTFSNRPKPMFFEENRTRFKPYLKKIIYAPITEGWPTGDNPWQREAFQRSMQNQFSFKDDDIITVSDCDEIPNPNVYSRFDKSRGIGTLDQVCCYCWIDVIMPENRNQCAKICTGKALRELGADGVRSAQKNPAIETQFLSQAGWHMTYIGDADFIRNKIKSFSHHRDESSQNVLNDPDLWRDKDFLSGKIVKVPIDGTWPKTILENMEFWKRYCCDR